MVRENIIWNCGSIIIYSNCCSSNSNGALWILLYKAVAWLAILALVIFIDIPVVTLIYTIYDNWFLIT